MATIRELVARGDLHEYDPDLPPDELQERTFLASDRVKNWVAETLPGLTQDLDRQLTPEQEFTALMDIYCGGTVLEFPRDLHAMRPVGQGVWEFRTKDLRFFGWFPKKDVFVAVSAHTAKRVKDLGLYNGLVAEVVSFRDRLDLTEPKFVEGVDPNAVISNYAYSS